MSPVIWTARLGNAWYSMAVRPSVDPGPSSSRPRRLVLASASGTEAGCPEAAHPGGGRQGQAPPGTSSARPPPPPFALRVAETTENEGRLLSPVVTVRQLRSSCIRRRRPSSSRRRRRRRCALRLLSADRWRRWHLAYAVRRPSRPRDECFLVRFP